MLNFPEVIRHPLKQDAERVFLLTVERAEKGEKDGKPIIVITGTDGSEDRHGSVLNPSGWELGPYRANPVFLWAHNQSEMPAIGKTLDLTQQKGRWDFTVEFAIDAWSRWGGPNWAQLVYDLYADKTLRASSVSFIPKEWKEREAQSVPSFFAENVEYIRQELTELSAVNVPSNRKALQKALADKKLGDNMIEALDLGSMLRVSVPVIHIGTEKPNPAVTSATVTSANTISNTADGSGLWTLKDTGCQYGDPSFNGWRIITTTTPSVDVDSEDRAKKKDTRSKELQHLEAISDALRDLADAALKGFDSAEHDSFRYFCANLVADCLYRTDRLLEWESVWEGGGDVYMLSAEEQAVREEINKKLRAVLDRVEALPKDDDNSEQLATLGALFDKAFNSSGDSPEDGHRETRQPDTVTDDDTAPEGDADLPPEVRDYVEVLFQPLLSKK